jgi:hypothetical protein
MAQGAPPLNPLAIDSPKLFLQQHGQLARAIEGMGGVQLVNPMLDRHFLRRGQSGLIVQAASADAEQFGLSDER